MIFLAYALFILILAAPFLLAAGIAWAFLAGVVNVARGVLKSRPLRILTGLLLLAGSSVSGLTLNHWAVTPPPDNSPDGIHAGVYKTVQALKARQKAMQWIADGTFQRLADEQRAKARQAPPTDQSRP